MDQGPIISLIDTISHCDPTKVMTSEFYPMYTKAFAMETGVSDHGPKVILQKIYR